MRTSKEIARDNDTFRTTFFTDPKHRIALSENVALLKESRPDLYPELITLVGEFKEFNEDNDPHHEHDFGEVVLEGEKYFWKIDYYDPTMTQGSEDPTDPAKTRRVLTIMLADEY